MKYILALVLASLFVMPEPAQAATSIVMVNAHVGSQDGNLRVGTKFVDKYTGSRFVYGKCRSEKRCITIVIDKTLDKGTAFASWPNNRRERVRIRVNPGRDSGYMRRLFAHEIAHGMFVEHSKYATNLMWPSLHKSNGQMVPFRFTKPQKRVLRGH